MTDLVTAQPATVGDALVQLGPAQLALATGATGSDSKVAQGRYGWCGYSCFASGGAACEFKVYDGNDATGTLLAHLQVASGASAMTHFGSPGILCRNGLFVHVVSGTPDLVLYAVPLTLVGPQ